MDRRTFLTLAGAAVPAAALGRPAPPRRRFRKAVKLGMVEGGESLEEKFHLLKGLGFGGVELESPNGFDRTEVLAAQDASGFPVHGVVDALHWSKPLSHPDAAVRAEGLAALRTALEDAHAYGASTVLLVPAVVNREVSYADAWTRSQAAVRTVLPLAERLGVRIAIENVWNGFLLSPLEFARYIDAFESAYVGAYFDVGNVVNFGWPTHWIEVLGPRILKLDVKEYSREKRDREGPYAGFRVPIGEGDCDWPAVRAALAAVGYSGWATAEVAGGDATRLADIARRMDLVLGI